MAQISSESGAKVHPQNKSTVQTPVKGKNSEDSVPKMNFRDALRGGKPQPNANINLRASHKPLRMPKIDPRKTESGCLKAADGTPIVKLDMGNIQTGIEDLEKRGLICRFVGFRPSLPAFKVWAAKSWKTKGELQISIYPNGYFLVLFANNEDREKTFQGGPWFFGRAGLFMKPWHTKFKAEEEIPSVAPVWVRLFGLPIEFWNPSVFSSIGNSLGTFMMTADCTQNFEHIIYARICVLMDFDKPLPKKITLQFGEDTWEQVVDYENIPFRCRICHEYGHLASACPNKIPEQKKEDVNSTGFQLPKKKNTQKKPVMKDQSKSSANMFEILSTNDVPSEEEEIVETEILETQFKYEGKNSEINQQIKGCQQKKKGEIVHKKNNLLNVKTSNNIGPYIDCVEPSSKILAVYEHSSRLEAISDSIGVTQETGKKKLKMDSNQKVGRKTNQYHMAKEGEKLVEEGKINALSNFFSTSINEDHHLEH